MSLYTLGLSHTTAPLDVREKVAFAPERLPDALRDLVGARKVREAAILSTCNRTEVYFHGARSRSDRALARGRARLPQQALAPYIYTLPHDKAVAHAFRVASGLDSMVLGEPQILGQMKQAVRAAEARRRAGPRAQSAVPAHVRGRQGRAHAHRHRQRVDLDGGGRGQARAAHLSRRSPIAGCC
jgi:glutamyl-tRNA reductase